MHELLTPAEMYRTDALAVAAGVPSLTLMENAGRAVAEEIVRRYGARKTLVLCGPGNNGGDGFVCARYLKHWGWPVRVALYGQLAALKGDAAVMAAKWDGAVEDIVLTLKRMSDSYEPVIVEPWNSEFELIVDAIFGAGLSSPFPEEWSDALAGRAPIVAIDVPSGLEGATGDVFGSCTAANLTVTFFRKKPAHVLVPGRLICGEIVVADIGIPSRVIDDILPKAFENVAFGGLPFADAMGHKYTRGHAVIVSGGPLNTGAARLAAQAAAKAGAGLVTLNGSREALAVHATHVTAIMLSEAELGEVLADKRKNAVCIGPASGVGSRIRGAVEVCLRSGAAVVLDADALTSFADDPPALFGLIAERSERPVVMTPHDGEFSRLFKDLSVSGDSRLERARKAAARSRAVVILKGPDTVIARPDGMAKINTNAPPSLATAGSGDVLAGLITGLLAQHLDAFDAACAAVWLHGDAANRHGLRRLTAESLIEAL